MKESDSGGSSVVEKLTRYPKFVGLNPACAERM